MKKVVLTVVMAALVAICAVMVAGCTSTKLGATLDQGKVVVENKDITITLKSNPSTGYQWSYELSDNAAIESSGESFKGGDSATTAGAPGTQTYTFKGVKAGETTITLTYVRPWEERSDADEQCKVIVTTDGSGNVTKLVAIG